MEEKTKPLRATKLAPEPTPEWQARRLYGRRNWAVGPWTWTDMKKSHCFQKERVSS